MTLIVTLSRFIELLYEIAMIENSGTKNKDHAVDDYIRERILKKGGMEKSSELKHEQWFLEVDGFEIKEFIESKKSYFTDV